MATSQLLLARLLNTPDLAKIVPRLPAEVLHRVIQVCGLEDSAEFVALATPRQLARILDVDVWRVRARGADDTFDADRFGVWLNVLMESGAGVAAEKLIGLDLELVIAGFARHTAVFDHAAVSSYTTLDGTLVPSRVSNDALVSEIGGYVIEARRTSAWDAIVELLAFLDSEQSEYFQHLMRECVRLSNGLREADGFHDLLQDRDQELFDLASDREARREKQGYVTPAQARAFMQAARRVQLDGDRPPHSPMARAYFRAIEPAPPVEGDAPRETAGALPGSTADAVSDIEADAMRGVVEILSEAGVLTSQPRALLEAADGETSRIPLIEAYVASHPASAEELAYLANVIIGGCSIQARPFTSQEASDAALAICNLGLENWPRRWADCDLVTAFQVGWTLLHRDVCMYTAERLTSVIDDLTCRDRDIHMRLRVLRRDLTRHVRDSAPWRARDALDVIVMLDAPSWAALGALMDECPVMHAAIGASRQRCRAINPSDYEFISQNSQIAVVRDFMESLPARLAR